MGHTIAELLSRGAKLLELSSESPRLDAEVLLAFALEKSREHLHTWPEEVVATDRARLYEDLLQRRARRQPVAQLTGRKEFWSMQLEITSNTLIPRPETELLVEQALHRIPPGQACTVLELGTGSGAVAFALARERPRCAIVATDVSPSALAVARANAQRLALDNVRFILSDWFEALGVEDFDVIVSNPPYVAEDHPDLEDQDISFEPRIALAAGLQGLDAIKRIAAGACTHLKSGAWLLLEHGDEQGDAVDDILRGAGLTHCSNYADLGGRPRVTEGQNHLG